MKSKITYSLPKEFLASSDNPVNTILIRRKSIARAALYDMVSPGFNENQSIKDRTAKAIDWVLGDSIRVVSFYLNK